ncbi:putative neurotrimin-like isoform X3 [Penaeus vannamei]|uniref:Putative neurotrimin-like isoform X3 n=1 Tax=Penaeus vannamei TaxID=6689 RepID=A0A423SUL4_PENVA|nr:putative neurotrimin-like isoform X3 [Penaeus vannamei]
MQAKPPPSKADADPAAHSQGGSHGRNTQKFIDHSNPGERRPIRRRHVLKDRRYRRDDEITLDTSMFLKESPYFEIPVQNVTARVGRTAKLTCVVENLGHFKVAWGYKVTGAVLTVATQVITKNTRISVQREQQSTWVLTISNVTMKDQGDYWCQVNTSPPRSISGYLSVVEPPVMEGGNEEVTITSGEVANLTCRARGTPTPTIRWIREDYDRIRINATYFASDYIGSSLLLRTVNHRSAAGYLCIASNGHPPSISRRVIVHVK